MPDTSGISTERQRPKNHNVSLDATSHQGSPLKVDSALAFQSAVQLKMTRQKKKKRRNSAEWQTHLPISRHLFFSLGKQRHLLCISRTGRNENIKAKKKRKLWLWRVITRDWVHAHWPLQWATGNDAAARIGWSKRADLSSKRDVCVIFGIRRAWWPSMNIQNNISGVKKTHPLTHPTPYPLHWTIDSRWKRRR